MFTSLGAIQNSAFNQRPVIRTTAESNTNTSSTSTESANNALNTFQNIETSSKVDNSSKQTQQLGEAIANATKSTNSGSDNNTSEGDSSVALSDERCKELFGSDCNLLGAIADLNEYIYKYKKSAQENPELEGHHVDDETHVGPMAQELKANPVTEGTVHEDPLTGFLTVDTAQLSLTEMSILSAMAKRIEAIEAKLSQKSN